MFERFTERARQIVVIGQELARDHRHEAIGADHLLVACAMEQDGLAGRLLRGHGFDLTHAENLLDTMNSDGTVSSPMVGQIPFTAEGKKALEQALREALELGHNFIGTEHILLGLLRETRATSRAAAAHDGPSPVQVMLDSNHLDRAALRRIVLEVLGGRSLSDIMDPADQPEPIQPDDFMPQLIQQLMQASTSDVQIRRLATTARPTRPFQVEKFGMTRQDLQDIGDAALHSMGIIGVPPEFVDGYARLADAASHLLNLCAAQDAARTPA
jgi:hypothetical protein